MQWFIVETTNTPGELARHAADIGKRGVNLSGLVGLGIGDRGGFGFYSTDEGALRTALNEAGLAYREISAVTVRLEDQPGTAAAVAQTLADAGVNIELFTPMSSTDQKVTVAIGVDDVEKARQALGDLVTEWTNPMAGTPR